MVTAIHENQGTTQKQLNVVVFKAVHFDGKQRVSLSIPMEYVIDSLFFENLMIGKNERHPFQLVYKVGVIAYPPKQIPDALIFAFDSRANALEYLEPRKLQQVRLELYEAVTEWTKPIEQESASLDERWLLRFWAGQWTGNRSAPHGSVVCPCLKLTKLVWTNQEEHDKDNRRT